MKKLMPLNGSNASEISVQEFIVKQRELETKLRIAETKYQELYEFAPIGYFDLDEMGRIVKINLGGSKLLGMPRIRMLGKFLSSFVMKNSHAIFKAHLQQVISSHIKQCCELELIREDGSSFYAELESILVLDPLQNATHIHITILDIGERRLTEQALLVSEEKFRSIIETTKEWVWEINLKGKFLYSNPAVKNMLGYSINELLNSARLLLIHKDDRPLVIKNLWHAVKNKEGWSDLIVRWRCKNGSYCYLESNSVPYFNRFGKVIGFRGADRDITLRKQAEEQARQYQTVLNQVSKMNSMGELASTLAHELTQPLTAINNFLGGSIKRMHKNNDHDVAILSALKQASQQAERAGQIIHRMKDFVQLGKLFLNKVNINEVIYESIELIKNEFPLSPVKIIFQPIGLELLITADKIQLVQVVLNLMRNSIEAMLDDSTLNPEVHIKCAYHRNHTIMVSVVDNGPGICDIEEDGLDKVFKACFTTKSKGLGLGLSISRTLIEAHQGVLIAQKNPQKKGACFQFIMPINQEYKLNQDPTIFIVAADLAICNNLYWLFTSVGLSVEVYPNASDYLKAYDENRLGCLVIDISLPGMSGLELQQQLIKRQNNIPIIIVAGHADTIPTSQAIKAGAKDFILKPVNNVLLLEKIKKIIA